MEKLQGYYLTTLDRKAIKSAIQSGANTAKTPRKMYFLEHLIDNIYEVLINVEGEKTGHYIVKA